LKRLETDALALGLDVDLAELVVLHELDHSRISSIFIAPPFSLTPRTANGAALSDDAYETEAAPDDLHRYPTLDTRSSFPALAVLSQFGEKPLESIPDSATLLLHPRQLPRLGAQVGKITLVARHRRSQDAH